MQLSKASTLALISMGIIVATVVIQGVLTPLEERGSFTTPLLTINDGISQAIGVISFGRSPNPTHARAPTMRESQLTSYHQLSFANIIPS